MSGKHQRVVWQRQQLDCIVTDPGLPKAQGQTYRLRVGAFFDVKGGKIVRVSTHYNMNDWKRQVLGR